MASVSRRVLCRPHRWHVQEDGPSDAPQILLLHGAGGATQSWRNLFPLLAQTHRTIALDMPGQGYTALGARARCGLDPVSEDIAALIAQEGWRPALVIGHSAGAALALRLSERGALPGAALVGLNAALAPFRGVAGFLFPALARAMAITPLTAAAFSATATENTVRRLIDSTGSNMDSEGIALYLRLLRDRDHVDGTLSMMAQWQLDGLIGRMPGIVAEVTLITGAGDRTVAPRTSAAAASALPNARHIDLPTLGHLMHEEDAPRVLDALRPSLPPIA